MKAAEIAQLRCDDNVLKRQQKWRELDAPFDGRSMKASVFREIC